MKSPSTGRMASMGAAAAAMVILATTPAVAVPSQHTEETSLLCDFEMEAHFQNPISLQPSSGWIRTTTPGEVSCSGTWRGEPADGLKANIRYDGYTEDATCAQAVIGGKISVVGANVERPITLTFETRRVGPFGFSSGETEDGTLRYAAGVRLERRDGEDCISKPLTGGYVNGTVLLYGI